SRIVLLFLLPIGTIALQCYTGTSYMKGDNVFEEKKTCNAGESCIFAYAKVHALVKLKNSGCSNWRCKYIGTNACKYVTIAGVEINGCCCNNEDFCQPEVSVLRNKPQATVSKTQSRKYGRLSKMRSPDNT
ncbi:hypothetical protein PENTCL1PPCAC_28897, partial [Pristionchus entomophagus]